MPCELIAQLRSCHLAAIVPVSPREGSVGMPLVPVPESCPSGGCPALPGVSALQGSSKSEAGCLAGNPIIKKDAVQTASCSEKEKENPVTGSKSISQNSTLSLNTNLPLPRTCFFSVRTKDLLEA